MKVLSVLVWKEGVNALVGKGFGATYFKNDAQQ